MLSSLKHDDGMILFSFFLLFSLVEQERKYQEVLKLKEAQNEENRKRYVIDRLPKYQLKSELILPGWSSFLVFYGEKQTVVNLIEAHNGFQNFLSVIIRPIITNTLY